MTIRQDLRKRSRVGREDALKVEVREVAYRDRIRREGPVRVVQREIADGGFVLDEEVVDLRRCTSRRVVRELHDVLEPREAQLACSVGRPGCVEPAAASALLPLEAGTGR